MTDELLALRAILLSPTQNDHSLFRQAASAIRIPVDVVEATGAAAAREALTGDADLLFVDGGYAAEEVAQVVAEARAAAKPPFTILLAEEGASAAPAVPPPIDAVAAKPARLPEARRLLERSMRACILGHALVVDDSSTMRAIVRKVLAATRFPFQVTEAAEGFAALQLVGEKEFDIVFLDYNMPGFSGLETLYEFRREQRAMTIVVMTSAQDEALASRVREAGAAFLRKPFFPADIEAALADHYGLIALNPARPGA